MTEKPESEGPADITARLRLSADEDLLLTAWQYRMMQRDVAATKGKSLEIKRAARDEFRRRVVPAIESEELGEFADPHIRKLVDVIETAGSTDRSTSFQALEEAPPTLTEVVTRRSRAILLLIDLYGYEPWPGAQWNKRIRTTVLEEFRDTLAPLRQEDLEAVGNAYDAAVKALAAKNRRWGRIAVIGSAGLGLGLLTAGLAAPAIGALVGTVVFGYSGAAAASAGLAALGGGSMASGGLGMAGGTLLVAGAGGATGLGLASAGGHGLGLTTRQIAADAIRLEVSTRLVLLDVEGDDQAARAVVLALRERLLNLRGQILELASRIEELKKERDELRTALTREERARTEAESTIRTLRSRLDGALRREEDESLAALDAELAKLEAESRNTRVVSEFVESRADLLDRSA